MTTATMPCCNALGREIIRAAEGLRLDAYLCPAGIPTIGYGHTGGVKMGDTITREQADFLLSMDLADVERQVASAVKVPLSSNEFAALCSFVFNLGIGRLRGSTLLARLNAGDKVSAAEQFLVWNKSGGKVLPGLAKRREAERALFLTPDQVAA
ncbi:putative lysozyme [Magnetospirillum sp. XM-1]|uniref:lysozyme n=1 Tax=Magnetospirillum sp. XM-1 TaxID=1663591 RepID=UPI00073DD621|nr:lysozyme [Magnetospirillum sp. XM-1]CUW39663.1 putative lysozyme [Magnetospirillum sp. XM-1]